jgi:hypothetical protein
MVVEKAGRVAKVHVEFVIATGDGLDQRIEELELFSGELRIFIGYWQMGTYSGELDPGCFAESFQCFAELMGQKSAPAHPGVESEVGLNRSVFSQLIEVFHFLEGAEAGSPAAGCNFFALGGKGRAENVRTGCDAILEESSGFSGVGDSEEREVFSFQFFGYFNEPMTVSTSLDDRHDVLAGVPSGKPEVLKEC